MFFVGEVTSKNDVGNVVNLYEEYIWLLKKIFGKKNTNRKTDRALWVYGNAKH